jgi:5-methylthioadenosine/S-adenosylhomocysteine deaminase
MTTASFDILLKARHISTLQAERPFVEHDICVGLRGRKITYIGPHHEGLSTQATHDYGEAWILPGLINAHTHLPMTLFRGFSDDEPLQDWLHKHIFPAEARLVNPEFCRIGTEIAALEAMLTGTTCFADMYYFEPDIADVIDKSGLRAFLGESVIDFPAPDNKKKDGNDYRLLDQLVERVKDNSRLEAMIAPHAPYTCSDETLIRATEYARAKDILLSIHVSETAFEVNESMKAHGKTPVARLRDIGLMDTPSLFAHCVHVSDDDIQIMSQKPVAAVYNPESNMKLGSGAAPIRKMLDAGVRVALGTDGCASNNDLNMIREMDTGAKLQKLSLADNSAITAQELIALATRDGATALGLENRIGQLKEGFDADLIAIDLRKPHLQPVHEVASLIYSLQGHEVRDVFVEGRKVVEEGRSLTIDQADLFDRLKFYRERMGF